MLPIDFIQKHSIHLNKTEINLCQQAMEIMTHSRDVNHNDLHIFRMLDLLDAFLATEEYALHYTFELDIKILFIAIMWHDTWKAQKDPKNIFMLLRDEIWEGRGAAAMFAKAVKNSDLPVDSIERIAYIIKKHSIFQILPINTIEAKIFVDLDDLDCFNLERLYLIEKKYLCDRPITQFTLNMAKFAVNIFIEKKTEKHFHSQWAKQKYLAKKEEILTIIYAEISEYEKLVHLLKKNMFEKFKEYHSFLIKKHINRLEKLKLINQLNFTYPEQASKVS